LGHDAEVLSKYAVLILPNAVALSE